MDLSKLKVGDTVLAAKDLYWTDGIDDHPFAFKDEAGDVVSVHLMSDGTTGILVQFWPDDPPSQIWDGDDVKPVGVGPVKRPY